MGPVASQEVIKELGTNGGGFFNANSAHPFENPTPLTNFIEMVLIFAIPAALTYTFGRMAEEPAAGLGDLRRHGVAVLRRRRGRLRGRVGRQPGAGRAAASTRASGNMEGKEVRFGIANSALFATVTTDASCGAVNSMHDSFTPLGGLVPLVNIMLGEVIFGGVGAGLYGILVMVLLSVFIAGLMVGPHARVPGQEDRGARDEGRDALRAHLPARHPGLRGAGRRWPATGTSSLNNAGPHGLTEILYAFTSGTGNNGSAFAGLNANTPFYNTTLGLAMLVGRFLMIIPALAIAGSMVGKKTVAPGPGHLPHQRRAVLRPARRR